LQNINATAKHNLQTLARKPIILDGSMGMELEHRGFHCRLPLWSAWALIEAPELVLQIHKDYLLAGADVLTAATFRTTRHALAKEGLAERAGDLTRLALRLARQAVDQVEMDRDVLIAGSIAPLEDCYKPELAPAKAVLEREHQVNAENLLAAGADLLLVETQNSRREVVIASKAALATGLPVWTSLMPRSASEMFNGDSLVDTAKEVAQLGVDALLVNCCELRIAAQAFATLRIAFPEMKLGLYPNNLEGKVSPELFADWGAQFKTSASIIGCCCGFGPEHIRELSKTLNKR
jgi:S-methylmethionine-dependent homocysteine/selenocysteine methylase